MGSLTPRGKLYKPAENGEVVDIARLNQNFDDIDTYGLGPYVCTKVSRPNAPYMGMQIYETDTMRIRMWTGDTTKGDNGWIWIGGKPIAVGVGQTASNTQVLVNNTNTLIDYSGTGTGDGRYLYMNNFTGNDDVIARSAIKYPAAGSWRGLKVSEAGLYQIDFSLQINGNYQMQHWVGASASETYNGFDWRGIPGGGESQGTITLSVDKNSYIYHAAYQGSGAAGAISRAGNVPRMTVTYLGAI